MDASASTTGGVPHSCWSALYICCEELQRCGLWRTNRTLQLGLHARKAAFFSALVFRDLAAGKWLGVPGHFYQPFVRAIAIVFSHFSIVLTTILKDTAGVGVVPSTLHAKTNSPTWTEDWSETQLSSTVHAGDMSCTPTPPTSSTAVTACHTSITATNKDGFLEMKGENVPLVFNYRSTPHKTGKSP